MEQQQQPPATKKGTVTPLSSMFPVEEAQKASKRVEDAVAEKQKELNNVKQFIADNTNLVNLVSRLPDELHHDVMVPFGKAAFFPGRLVHTNEFMVLLGEGYYAERTAKQTVEILKRRGKALESQVQSMKANIEDLRAEASFFDSTASEAVEGLVEIREDYVEDSFSDTRSKSDEKKVTVDDDEYSRIMSRLDELEREELAAEGADGGDGYEDEEKDENEDEDEDEEEEEEEANNTDESGQDKQISTIETGVRIDESNLERRMAERVTKDEKTAAELLSHDYQHRLHITDDSSCTGLAVQSVSEDEMSKGKSLIRDVERSPSGGRNSVFAEVNEKTRVMSSSSNETPMQTTKQELDSSRAFTGSILERSDHNQRIPGEQTVSSPQKPSQNSRPSMSGFDSWKAFTGSIVEHTQNLQPTSPGQNATSSQPSKPVSRFKMQRRH